MRLDRAWREGASFSRYDLMVFIALDVMKINVQGSLLITERQKVKTSVAVLAYDFAGLIRIGGIIEALYNLFAVRSQTLNRLKHGVSALNLRASIVVNFLVADVGAGKEVFVMGGGKIQARDFNVHRNAASDVLKVEAMDRASALIRLKPGGERGHYRESPLARELFGLPGQGLLYLLDIPHVFPHSLNFLSVPPHDSQREDQNYNVESGKDDEKKVQCFRLHFFVPP